MESYERRGCFCLSPAMLPLPHLLCHPSTQPCNASSSLPAVSPLHPALQCFLFPACCVTPPPSPAMFPLPCLQCHPSTQPLPSSSPARPSAPRWPLPSPPPFNLSLFQQKTRTNGDLFHVANPAAKLETQLSRFEATASVSSGGVTFRLILRAVSAVGRGIQATYTCAWV